ncbi:hypothetical protein E2C01_001971 [Portunus trituberculatus]|uniref:Uncharacterized protein n=1 Tax=Portunus trituberculatus TaxID=210409 RepID=A0A5B7CI58_PORTR|nr:hypothetical protein [Portunus trituberculatus]
MAPSKYETILVRSWHLTVNTTHCTLRISNNLGERLSVEGNNFGEFSTIQHQFSSLFTSLLSPFFGALVT